MKDRTPKRRRKQGKQEPEPRPSDGSEGERVLDLGDEDRIEKLPDRGGSFEKQ
jgi:hypothetical protein